MFDTCWSHFKTPSDTRQMGFLVNLVPVLYRQIFFGVLFYGLMEGISMMPEWR